MEEFENFQWINEIPESFDEWVIREYPKNGEDIINLLKDYENLTPRLDNTRTFYDISENNPLFYFYTNRMNQRCYFNYWGFWEVFWYDYGLQYSEIQEILIQWLEMNYNLSGLRPESSYHNVFKKN